MRVSSERLGGAGPKELGCNSQHGGIVEAFDPGNVTMRSVLSRSWSGKGVDCS